MTEQEQDAEILRLSKSLLQMLDVQKRMLDGIDGVIFEIRQLNAEIGKLRDAAERPQL